MRGNNYQAYERGSLLGDCGWFTVHAATHRPSGDKVVLKEHFEFLVEDSRYVSRMLDLYEVLAGIDHPDLVTVIDAGCDGRSLWSAEQFVAGRSLLAWLAEGWVTPELALRIAVRVLNLLDMVHGRGIVHGCLHAGTIRMAGPDEPRLGDFGLTAADPRLVGPQNTGTFGFYRPYCDPDVLAGRGPTPDSDLFAVGVLLRECFGREPIPDAVAEIVRLATGRRGFASAAEMAAAIDALE